MKETRVVRNPEKSMPPEKKAADLFILASRKYAASVTLQGAEIARICKSNDYHPASLRAALIQDCHQLARIKELADREHTKRNYREEELANKGEQDLLEVKYIPPIEPEDVYDVVRGSYYWAIMMYKLPNPEIKEVIEHAVDPTLCVKEREQVRINLINEKLTRLQATRQSLKQE